MANTVSRTLSDDTLNRIIQIESGGKPNAKAPTSSATGLFQFIDGTWMSTVNRHRPDLSKGRNRAEILALRFDPAISIEMGARFTEDNARQLGSVYQDGDLYLAHFAGIGVAKKLLNAPQSDPASKYFSAGAITANQSILQGRTVGEVRAWAQRSMVTRWDKAGRTDWIKRFAGAGVVPQPPDVPAPVNVPMAKPRPEPPKTTTKEKGGLWAFILLVLGGVWSFIETYPVATFLGIAAAIAAVWAFFWWRRFRARNDIPLGEE